VTRWARESGTTTFFFEAFDENWKGGDHPDEVEKHWGLFRADRTPKPALAGGG
jgi:exo-beta-1,3-glucanase (GH17 family)